MECVCEADVGCATGNSLLPYRTTKKYYSHKTVVIKRFLCFVEQIRKFDQIISKFLLEFFSLQDARSTTCSSTTQSA